jgi:prepilin-type N-terminal cleavage/methylation domain-containing protein
MFNFKKAFTLAEVLITLGIIGIVAALVMPGLIANYQEKEIAAKLKKVYSTLSNAYVLAMEENGGPLLTWEGASRTAGSGGELVFAENMLKHMNVSKYCGNDGGCFPDVMYITLKAGANYSHWEQLPNRAKAILSDGTSIMFNMSDNLQIYVDINGFKPPNQLGKDFFYFFVVNNKIFPGGTPESNIGGDFKAGCLNATANGTTCAAWVIFNENMDYLHCSDLSWYGKTRCD